MARAIKKLENGLSIRYIKKAKKYFLTYGVEHITIDKRQYNPFDSVEDAERVGNSLKPTNFYSRFTTE